MLTFEHYYWREHPAGVLAGVDEAGRGPLAGPVYAGAVVIRCEAIEELYNGPLAPLTDSKRLTASRRERFFALLESHADIRTGIGVASVAESTGSASQRRISPCAALFRLSARPSDFLLVDGLPVRGLRAIPFCRWRWTQPADRGGQRDGQVARDRHMRS